MKLVSFLMASFLSAAVSCMLVSCATSPASPDDGDYSRFTMTPLSEEQREVLWSDTITPPANPFAPAADDSMVTVWGEIGLGAIPFSYSNEMYCQIVTANYTAYFLTSRQSPTHGNTARFTLWRYDAPMLQPGYAGNSDTIRVGDTIAVTGYAYAMEYAHAMVLDVQFVQKYSVPSTNNQDEE